MSFTLAIIGRPNVGKSTLFNRLTGKQSAIVSTLPGTTRDRRKGEAVLGGMCFSVIDTAGLEETTSDVLEAQMMAQTERAVDEADIVLLLLDGKEGVTPLDRHFASWLRRKKISIILGVNKCDSKKAEACLAEAYELGLGSAVALSAEHGHGLATLYDALFAFNAKEEDPQGEEGGEDHLRIAFIGRPNVGKSTLLNTIVKEERTIAGPQAGITRDAIEIEWLYRGKKMVLVDTAGIRKKARITDALEKSSVADSLNAIRYAHVVALLVDATQGIDRQDLSLAGHVIEEGRALLVAANKWDAIVDKASTLKAIRERLESALPQARNVPVIPISGRDGTNLPALMACVLSLYEKWNMRISTARLNRWLESALERNPPPLSGNRRIRLRYATQIKTRPPSFVLFSSSNVNRLPESYLRYLLNDLRGTFEFAGIPLRLHIRKAENPFS